MSARLIIPSEEDGLKKMEKMGSDHPNSVQLFVSIELICHLQMKFPLKTPFMPSKTRLKYLMPALRRYFPRMPGLLAQGVLLLKTMFWRVKSAF